MPFAALLAALAAAPLGPAPEVTPVYDVPITIGASAGWLALHLNQGEWAPTRCPCDAPGLPFERWVLRDALGGAEQAADLTAALTMTAPFVLLALSSPTPRAYANDALLVAESMALAGLLTSGLKVTVGRPYPYMYRDPAPGQLNDGVNYGSFPSGHTAVPMAGAVTFATLLGRRHPDSVWRYVAWGVGPALALTAGGLQVAAQNHFPTDVAAGAMLGAGVGWAVPWLHGAW